MKRLIVREADVFRAIAPFAGARIETRACVFHERRAIDRPLRGGAD